MTADKPFAVIATGQSLTGEQVEYVRGKAQAVAVSDAYKLCPWADALVSHDAAWWRHHPDAMEFAGAKFSGVEWIEGVERLGVGAGFPPGCNSGLQGMRVAKKLGATRIILLGFDMHGTHFFGPHGGALKNTTPKHFVKMAAQFNDWHGPPVTNCTPGTALTCFPMANLTDVL